MALLVSALLHALMLLSLSGYSAHSNVFTRPVHAPLSVRIEKLPEAPEATPIVINDKNVKKASVHQKLTVSKPVAPSEPAEIEPSLTQPGVSVSETLYLRPLSGRISNPLLAAGEFRRSSDISEKAEAVAIRVPDYPGAARKQQISGWVIVMLLVDELGKVVDAAAVDSSETFSAYEADVAEALRGSTYIPGKLYGRAVKTIVFVRVRFDSKGLSGLETARDATAPAPVENK